MRRLVAAVAVLVLAATACSARGGRATTTTTTPPPPTATEAPTTTTTGLVAASGQCGLHGSYPTPWPDRPRYRASLQVDPAQRTVHGDVEVRFAAPRSTDRYVFRLWGNIPRAATGGGRMVIDEARLDGRSVRTAYEPGGAGRGTPGTIFDVFGDFGPEASHTVRLRFTLTMPGAVNERIAQIGDSMRLGSVLPTLSWIRGIGWHTSPAVTNFSESAASEVADYDVTVRVPEGFTVLATGRALSPDHFVARSVRDWAATIGRLRMARGIARGGAVAVTVGVAEGSGDDPDRRLAEAVRALDAYSERYGPYPYSQLSVGITGSLSGGIEFPEHVMVGSGTPSEHLDHEVAHQWFYGLVGNDQYAHPWLDEGLTQYVEERLLGRVAATRTRSIPSDARGHLGAGHEFWSHHTGSFFRGVYIQGVEALAAVGDAIGGLDPLDCALRRYVLENAYRVATPDDLVRAIHEQTGIDPTPILARFGGP